MAIKGILIHTFLLAFSSITGGEMQEEKEQEIEETTLKISSPETYADFPEKIKNIVKIEDNKVIERTENKFNQNSEAEKGYIISETDVRNYSKNFKSQTDPIVEKIPIKSDYNPDYMFHIIGNGEDEIMVKNNTEEYNDPETERPAEDYAVLETTCLGSCQFPLEAEKCEVSGCSPNSTSRNNIDNATGQNGKNIALIQGTGKAENKSTSVHIKTKCPQSCEAPNNLCAIMDCKSEINKENLGGDSKITSGYKQESVSETILETLYPSCRCSEFDKLDSIAPIGSVILELGLSGTDIKNKINNSTEIGENVSSQQNPCHNVCKSVKESRKKNVHLFRQMLHNRAQKKLKCIQDGNIGNHIFVERCCPDICKHPPTIYVKINCNMVGCR